MVLIKNPVIPGMAPDPSILRVGEKYYIANSTFHWQPAIQIFESTDLANWSLCDYVLKNEEINLKGTNTPAGIWAPHLSYDEKNKKFWLAYSQMVNMAGREFNADSYLLYADDIHGPWSKPIFLTAIGFDPSIFHDDDGRHYVSILEWETRQGYQAPGHIVIAEIDLENHQLISKWQRITTGFTSRGCVEAPQLYKHGEYYYLLLASGGTGYGHGIEIGRSRNIFGPYEGHPSGEPIITSSPRHLFSLGDPDAGHFEMYNPLSTIQKSGHGSLVSTPDGEWYIAHLMSRPLKDKLLNPLGRETAIQKVHWTKEGWLELADGTNLAKEYVDVKNSESVTSYDVFDIFEHSKYDNRFMTPYQSQNKKWVNTVESKNHLRIYGGNSLFSKHSPSIMATRATSFKYEIETEVLFSPDHYSETAGVGLYYDCNNWLYLNIGFSEEKDQNVINVLQAKLGKKVEFPYNKFYLNSGYVKLKIIYDNGVASLLYSQNDEWCKVIENTDVTYLSDEGVNGEPGEIGGFTGLFNFIAAVDAYQRETYADFSYYRVTNFE